MFLHRLPAVANIILTREYSWFAQQTMSGHDRANKQADMDGSPMGAMGDTLAEMQGCLNNFVAALQLAIQRLWLS